MPVEIAVIQMINLSCTSGLIIQLLELTVVYLGTRVIKTSDVDTADKNIRYG